MFRKVLIGAMVGCMLFSGQTSAVLADTVDVEIVETMEIETMEIETMEIETMEIETMEIETVEIETVETETVVEETLETEIVEEVKLDEGARNSVGFEYTLNENNEATITDYLGGSSAMAIPSTIDGYTVVAIGSDVFAGCDFILQVTIPDTVKVIGKGAFSNCENLSHVTLSTSLTSLGYHAFYNCDELTSIQIPSSLETTTTLSNYRGPFAGCDNLKNITFGIGTTKIVKELFANCSGLESITIPATVNTIETGAFRLCENLKTVEIPNSVTVIEESAFLSCSALTKADLPSNLINLGTSAFSSCVSLPKVELPKTLEMIGYYAFYDCDSLASVEIPKSLVTVTTLNNYRGVFAECDNLKTVTFEAGTTKVLSNLFANCNGLEEIVIPDTITVIEKQAFLKCENLKNVTIANSVTAIEESAFSNCTSLVKVDLPENLTTIGVSAFSTCTSLSEVELPKTLEMIGYYAFYDCDSLTSIEIPKSLTKATSLTNSRGAFAGCDNLKRVTFEEGVTEVVAYLFANCNGLEEIVIPETVTTIGQYAFYQCENLKRVTLPAQLNDVDDYAFAYCGALSQIVLPDTVTKISTYAFAQCDSLTDVKLPNSLEMIGYAAYYQCDGLTSIHIPASLTTSTSSGLSRGSFTNCDNLKTVTFDESITVIPANIFAGCTGLETVIIPYYIKEIGNNAFYNCDNLTKVVIPRRTVTIGTSTFSSIEQLTIYGVSGTYAESYAASKNIPFVAQNIPATAVTLDATEKTIPKGESFRLVAAIAPADFTDEVVWTSSNEAMAKVSDTGYVETFKSGNVDITVTVGNVSATCTVTVERSLKEQQVCAFVERMYTIVLNRAADPNGLNDWADGLIEQRVDGAAVVNGFVNSAEFAARGLSDEDYIKTLYLAILNREADENGLNDWLRAFELGQTRADLLNGFVTSAEFDALCDSYGILAVMTQEDMVRNFASRMYTVALNRPADEAGLTYWVGKLMSGSADGAAIADGFINSAEFRARNLSDEDYIKTLYLTFLNREADANGLADWLRAFSLGQTRQQMLDGFIASAEFGALCDSYGISAILTQRDLVENFVKRMYTVALNREYDVNGLNDWVTGLINGVIYGAQVADGFIMSAEFEARGLSDEDYVKTLYQTFFNRSAGQSDVDGWVAAMTVYGQSRRDVMNGFIMSAEFAALCNEYGIIRGTLQQ